MKVISILVCCLLLSGCTGASVSDTVPNTPSATVSTTQPAEVLTVFTPNDNADALIKTEVDVQEITKEAVVAQLIQVGVLSDGTVLNSLEIDSGSRQLKADFNSTFLQTLQTSGTAGEYMIMGSVVNTLLSAFDADSITITVDGSILETGHSVYDQPLTFYPDNT